MSSSRTVTKLSTDNIESWADLQAFLDGHERHWNWLTNEALSGAAETVRDRILDAYRSTKRSLLNFQNQGHGVGTGINAVNAKDDLIHAGSPLGVLFDDALAATNVSAALFALGFDAGWVALDEARSSDDLTGAIWLVSPGFAAHASFSEQLRRERANLRSTVRQIAEESKQATENANLSWQRTLGEAQSVSKRWAAVRSQKLRTASRAWRDRHEASEANIRSVESAYREHMGLKAPVEYWKIKAGQHKNAEFWSRIWVLIFFPVALVGMALAFNNTGISLIDAAQAARTPGSAPFPTAIFIVASAGLASCAGLVFWVGRLLTKLYLSQHHLRQDAEERATMTETYLALIENGAASDADRQVILNALFRNTPDGIVKEDGGLDPSIAAALGKFLAKP